MDTPENRAEFERRFFILMEQIKQDKFHVAQGISTGLDEVRFLPNGRIDFLSVNEMARLQANTAVQFLEHDMKNPIGQQTEQRDPPQSDEGGERGEGEVSANE